MRKKLLLLDLMQKFQIASTIASENKKASTFHIVPSIGTGTN